MNCSFCACAAPAAIKLAETIAAANNAAFRSVICLLLGSRFCFQNPSVSHSMREGPKPELLLGDRPQACEAVRFDHQEEDDQGAEDHRFEVRDRGGADLPADQLAERRQRLVEEDWQED